MATNRVLMKLVGRTHTFLYGLTGGRVGSRMYGSRIVLLTTTGRRSGKTRTTALLSMRDGENTIIVASNGGSDQHPAWWLNLRQNADAELQIGGERKRVRAETANEEERARLWPRLVEMNSGYEGYQKGTQRTIPVVILRPAEQR